MHAKNYDNWLRVVKVIAIKKVFFGPPWSCSNSQVFLDQELTLHHDSSCRLVLLTGTTALQAHSKSPRFRHFKLDRDEIWQNHSSSKLISLFFLARKHKVAGRGYWRKIIWPSQWRLCYCESVVEGDRISPAVVKPWTAAETGNLFLVFSHVKSLPQSWGITSADRSGVTVNTWLYRAVLCGI